jgi:hypothetical protein
MGPTGAYNRQPESSPRTWASQLSSAKYSLWPCPKDQALLPVGGIIAHRQEIGQPFPLHEKNTYNLYLLTSARTSIADWLRSDPAKLPTKLYPKVSTALVGTAMPTLSRVSCKCSPSCSTLS